jgi:hypothetical protein
MVNIFEKINGNPYRGKMVPHLDGNAPNRQDQAL